MVGGMCGRVAQYTDPGALSRRFGVGGVPPNAPARWNGVPTQDFLVVRFNPDTRRRQLDLLRWGLVPLWAEDARVGSRLINARAEACARKPAFRDAFQRRRCLVPVDAFYEWRSGAQGKRPFAVALRSSEPMALAGLWERWRQPDGNILRSFTVITTDASPAVAPLHDRMPVVLPPSEHAKWLGEEEASAAELQGMLRPYDGELEIWPVSRRVNKPENDDPDILRESESD